nr:Uncharacterised protein [Ipomoea batatas]
MFSNASFSYAICCLSRKLDHSATELSPCSPTIYACTQVVSNEEAEAGRVQVGAGANDAVRRKPRELPCHVGQNIHGVGHDHENTIPGILHQLRDNLLEQRAVPLDEAEAALPGVLPRSGGDDHEVRPGRDGVVHGGVDLGAGEERGGMLQVQHLAAHLVRHGVDEGQLVGEILSKDGLGDRHPDVPHAHHGDLGVALRGGRRGRVGNGLEERLAQVQPARPE